MRTAIYMRVSTDKQDTDMQRHAIEEWIQANEGVQAAWFVDEGVSSKAKRRPAYDAMCKAVAAGEYDRVVVYRLDRLSRTAVTALRVLLDWARDDVDFIAVDQPLLSATADDPFRLTKLAMYAEIAQVERDVLVKRVKAGLAAARARGAQIGRKRSIDDATREAVCEARATGMTFKQIAKQFGLAVSTVHQIAGRGV